MYNRAFPVGNALFLFAGSVMSLLRLPRGKLPLAFLAVPAGKDGRVECPCHSDGSCMIWIFFEFYLSTDIDNIILWLCSE